MPFDSAAAPLPVAPVRTPIGGLAGRSLHRTAADPATAAARPIPQLPRHESLAAAQRAAAIRRGEEAP